MLMEYMHRRVWCPKLEKIVVTTDSGESRVDRVLDSLKCVNDALHRIRAQKASQKYRKWEWVSRTAELQVLLFCLSKEKLPYTVVEGY